MQRLRDWFRISSPVLRDRLGMVCAFGAVACLSGLIANWSGEYQVAHSRWEHKIFADLSGSDLRRPSGPAAESSSISSQSTEMTSDAQASNSDVTTKAGPSLFSSPIAERPLEQQPRFIQPKTSLEQAGTPIVRLTGIIEMETDEERDHRTASEAFNRL